MLRSGFTCIRITAAGGAEPGVHAAIIQAGRPAAPAGFLIRPMRPADAAGVLAVYQAGLDTGNASFEAAAPVWAEFDRACLACTGTWPLPRTGGVAGWIAASAVSDRCAYAGAGLRRPRRGTARGARRIYRGRRSLDHPDHHLPENTASLRLHEQVGFRVVGTRRRVGRWREVLMLERRSTIAGTA